VGLFGAKSSDEPSSQIPDEVVVTQDIRDVVPDAGERFLDWCGPVPDGLRERLEQAVDGLRAPNGLIPLSSIFRVRPFDPKAGPLTYLSAMCAQDDAVVTVWASSGLKRAESRSAERLASEILRRDGHAGAAAWVMSQQPQRRLGVDYLAESLASQWEEGLSRTTNGQFLKSIKKW